MKANKKRVLFVDDSKTQLIFVKGILEQAGYEVFTSENIWVSRLVLSIKPDVVLMDVEVNGFSGVDTVKAMKSGRAGKNVAIFLYSSKTQGELEELCNECHADGYICKADGEARLLGIVDAVTAEM